MDGGGGGGGGGQERGEATGHGQYTATVGMISSTIQLAFMNTTTCSQYVEQNNTNVFMTLLNQLSIQMEEYKDENVLL